MTTKLLIFVLFVFSSCSSVERSALTGAMAGGSLGATGGAVFSPTDDSRDKNAYLFGVLGSLLGAGIGYLLFEKPQNNKLQNQMLLEDSSSQKTQKESNELPLFDFAPELKDVRPEVSFKPTGRYEVPLKDVPPELEGKVRQQHIIEYEAEARTIELDNRTIEISPFKAWEVIYE